MRATDLTAYPKNYELKLHVFCVGGVQLLTDFRGIVVIGIVIVVVIGLIILFR